jgi:hypothetical protein
MHLALRSAESSLGIHLRFGISPRIAPRGARDFTMQTTCLRGENTVLRGDLASPRIYGFLKDLCESNRERLRTQSCIYFVLKDLTTLKCASPRIYGFLKDLDKWKRAYYRVVPCISFVFKDLRNPQRALLRAHPAF